MIPTRVANLEEARCAHGDLIDRLLPHLWLGDPLADAVVEELGGLPGVERNVLIDGRLAKLEETGAAKGYASESSEYPALDALIGAVIHVPVWVDWERIARARRVFLRAGLPGGIVLGAKSLAYGYASPGGNKPLVYSGRLRGDVARRLAETARFVAATCEPDGLRVGGAGFVATVKVRLMHAFVRKMLRKSPEWDPSHLGLPINQHDMVATSLLFSLTFVEGVRDFGFQITRQEADDYLHLWRYSGYLMGVDPELLPATEPEARRLAEVILMTQGEPDEDSRDLVRALVESPRAGADTGRRSLVEFQVALGYGMCRSLLGEALADKLELPSTPHRFAVPMVRRVIASVDGLARRVPRLERALCRAGERYWKNSVRAGLAGRPADFAPPERLATAG